jgi:hypothetical protein
MSKGALPAFAVLALVMVALVPVQSMQGIDYRVATHTLPLYAKALDFVQRDSMYERLAGEIAGGAISPEARALAIFDWTRAHIRDTPDGFPVVDDHISHIVIRGYGEDDQKADVFTTLSTYAGVPAFWPLTDPPSPELILSYVWIDGRWRVVDVANGIVFRRKDGALAAVEELAADASIVHSGAGDRTHRSKPYVSYFDGFRPPQAPDILRAELQMTWPRLTYRVRRFVGMTRRDWHTR